MFKIRIFLLFAGLFIINPINSQSIIRSSIGSTGSTSFNTGLLLRHTSGQSSATSVLSDNLGVLRQGFQQPVKHFSVTSSARPGTTVFRMFPNPAVDFLSIVVNEPDGSFEIQITDMLGKRVFQRKDLFDTRAEFNITPLSSGVYLVTIISGGKTETQRIIVLKN